MNEKPYTRGRIHITAELMKALLQLPERWDVTHMGYDYQSDNLVIHVRGDGLHTVPEGDVIPRITVNEERMPVYKMHWPLYCE